MKVIVAGLAVASCDTQPNPASNAQLTAGWLLHCKDAPFIQLQRSEVKAQISSRPIFQIGDELVLAIPTANQPVGSSIEHEPRTCHQLSDLPRSRFVSFSVFGNWSEGYKQTDIPIVSGSKLFTPDVISVRIEPDVDNLSEEQQLKMQLSIRQTLEDESTDQHNIGNLTCFIPKYWQRTECFNNRTRDNPAFTKIHYIRYASTSFILAQADYPSTRYGNLHIVWQGWILDPSRLPEVDSTIWKSIQEWNLNRGSQTGN